MENNKITDELIYIGVDDNKTKLFEGQYLIPNGISYNSYLIKSDKNIIMDTVDKVATDEWYKNIEENLHGEKVDYLIVSHMEPDHAFNIETLANKYPNMKIIGNQMTFKFMSQFFNIDNFDQRKIIVNEGETLTLGKSIFKFIMAPMIHWPEVMMTYYENEKILFTADAFGKFGALDHKEDWLCEARRYYFNIVGKYGIQVQNLFKKLNNIEIKTICPLHGPILKENIAYYIDKYNTWSSYTPEDEGILIAYASIHGNTANVAKELAAILTKKGVKNVVLRDLVNDDMSEAVEDAFRYDKMVLAASSYNAEVFPPMEHFLNHLKGKNFQKRKIGIIENGTWAPSAAKSMLDIINKMKDINLCNNIITIKSTLKESDLQLLDNMANELINC
jgi:hypothetical protein